MTTNIDNPFVDATDTEGQAYLCPSDAVSHPDRITDLEAEFCVEKEVVGRYAGNLS